MTEKMTERKELETRNAILKLLSDDEVASVSTAETALKLKDKAEYIDLDQLGKGVQHASKAAVVMGSVLPRAAVHEMTWKRIETELAGKPTPRT
jgi:hypothetical protein